MSLRICTAEFMVSSASGTGFSTSWFPRLVAERMATSSRDGTTDRAPDGVAFIDTDILWTNTTGDSQHLHASMHRGSRSFVTSNPNHAMLDDAYTFDIGRSPSAPIPSLTDNGFGGGLTVIQVSKPSTTAFARLFRDATDWVSNVELGIVEPDETVHLRYRALFTTPGAWGPESSRSEMYARWCRLRLWAAPWVNESI